MCFFHIPKSAIIPTASEARMLPTCSRPRSGTGWGDLFCNRCVDQRANIRLSDTSWSLHVCPFYTEVLRNSVRPGLNQLVDTNNIWFPLDGAIARTARWPINVKRGLFADHVVPLSMTHTILCPAARWPILTPYDVFVLFTGPLKKWRLQTPITRTGRALNNNRRRNCKHFTWDDRTNIPKLQKTIVGAHHMDNVMFHTQTEFVTKSCKPYKNSIWSSFQVYFFFFSFF